MRSSSGTDLRHDRVVQLLDQNRDRLGVALNEAEVVGVRLLDEPGAIGVMLHVAALPEFGEIDRDARRTLVLRGVDQVRVMLRLDMAGDGLGEPIPLSGLDSVDAFFASLSFGGSMYGWDFFDRADFTQDWPSPPSLQLTLSDQHPSHTFDWFMDHCGRVEDGQLRIYLIEGTVGFNEISIQRATGDDQLLETFIDEGVRWWQAFQDHDPRVGHEAQRAWGASRLTWRTWPGYNPDEAH